MPLKHDTETWLVFLLGLLTVVAGIVCVFLPPVSVALWPWATAFVLSLIYPFALYPYLKERRADNPFRLLHFAPAAVLLLWLIADLAAGVSGQLAPLQQWLTWQGAVLPVAAVLVLLALFCLSVLRQRWSRLVLLLLLLVAVAAFGIFNSRYHWDAMLAARVWGESGSLILAGEPTMSGSTASEAEARWRAQLRLMEERRRAIENGGTGSTSIGSAGSNSSSMIAGASSSVSSTPSELPHSGPTAEVLVFLTMSGFTTALHRRTMKRSKA